ncbi:PRD domain-containing protein, partial [Dubosiella newyorkensis]
YNSLLQNGIHNPNFENYEVLCVVGTLNPNIKHLHFIALDDLILQESNNSLDQYLEPYFSNTKLEEFKKNIIKNFSLSNIMNALTILNPTKLLEHVADAIDRLQKEMHLSLSNNTCFGLYVHVSCLVERLVMNRGIESYQDIGGFQTEQKNFIERVKRSFSDVEAFYGVQIPVEEIGYMFDYVKNDKNYQKCV